MKMRRFMVVLLITSALYVAFMHGSLSALDGRVVLADTEATGIPALSVTKAADVDTPVPGQVVVFTITAQAVVTSTQPMTVPLAITETLPADVTLIGATPGYAVGLPTLVWTEDMSLPGGPDPEMLTKYVTFTAQVSETLLAGTEIVNADYRTGLLGEAEQGAPITLTVGAVSSATLVTTDPATAVLYGASVPVSYTLTNAGNVMETFRFTGTLTADGAVDTWDVTWPNSVTLTARSETSVPVRVHVGRGALDTPVTATLALTAASDLGTQAVATHTLAARAFAGLDALTLTKQASTLTPRPGEVVTFTLVASAGVTAPLDYDLPLVITETLPVGVTQVGATPDYTVTAKGLRWSRTLSTAVGSEVVTVTVRVREALASGTELVNDDYRATVFGEMVAGTPVTLTVTPKHDVALAPQSRQGGAYYGDPIVLPYTLTNTGDRRDTFFVTRTLTSDVSLEGWAVSLPPSVTLDKDEARPVTVTVQTGTDPQLRGVQATLLLTVTSEKGARAVASADLVARPRAIFLPLVLRSYPPIPVIDDLQVTSDRGGAGYTYQPAIKVKVSATVENDVVQSMAFNGGEWQAYTSDPVPLTLPVGSGYKVIDVKVKGAKGGIATDSAGITLMANGDFGDGLDEWDPSAQALPSPTIDAGQALLGSKTLPCNEAPVGESQIAQTVDLTSVPAGASVKLYLDYVIHTEEKYGGEKYDHFAVVASGLKVLTDGYRGNDDYGCGKWHEVHSDPDTYVDLSAYRGGTFELRLANYTRYDHWYNTYTRVDNVHIVVDK